MVTLFIKGPIDIMNNFFMQQHKLEIKGKSFFFVWGGYTTRDGGESYDIVYGDKY
jgi:hypothetical protein